MRKKPRRQESSRGQRRALAPLPLPLRRPPPDGSPVPGPRRRTKGPLAAPRPHSPPGVRVGHRRGAAAEERGGEGQPRPGHGGLRAAALGQPPQSRPPGRGALRRSAEEKPWSGACVRRGRGEHSPAAAPSHPAPAAPRRTLPRPPPPGGCGGGGAACLPPARPRPRGSGRAAELSAATEPPRPAREERGDVWGRPHPPGSRTSPSGVPERLRASRGLAVFGAPPAHLPRGRGPAVPTGAVTCRCVAGRGAPRAQVCGEPAGHIKAPRWPRWLCNAGLARK